MGKKSIKGFYINYEEFKVYLYYTYISENISFILTMRNLK